MVNNDKRICDYIDGLLSPSEVNKLENEVLNLENRVLRKKFDDLHRSTEIIVGKSSPLPATMRLGLKRLQEAHNKFNEKTNDWDTTSKLNLITKEN